MINKESIEQILRQKFLIEFIEVRDDSVKHAGHAEVKGTSGGTHFTVVVVSKDFEGKSLVARHRLVNEALDKEFKSGLHALVIKALTPLESPKMGVPKSDSH